MHGRTAHAACAFVEFRSGADGDAMRAEVDAHRPHVVVVFRPEILPPGVFADLRAAVVGFLTEPIPRTRHGAHPDLRRRGRDLRGIDRDNVDRIVAFDPLIVPAADAYFPVWRSLPLPVADRFYRPVRRIDGPPRVLFVGRSTPHRERFLARPKAELDLLHVAFGIGAGDLERLMVDHDVAINIHNEPYLSFENRVCLHLAAGHLVLSETLSPTHGLEPGIDYVEFERADELAFMLSNVSRFPNAHHRIRIRGRRKAESFRASHVWPRLAADLLIDLRAFGTDRSAAA
jgi:hypothetical protein